MKTRSRFIILVISVFVIIGSSTFHTNQAVDARNSANCTYCPVSLDCFDYASTNCLCAEVELPPFGVLLH